MHDKRNNCIILLADAPEPGKINYELKTALGEERAIHVSRDLLHKAYSLAKNFEGGTFLISYEKTPSHPDLTWLDSEDPGFLETKGKSPSEQLFDAATLAFNAGAKKVLFLSHLSPAVKEEWLSQAFEAAEEKTLSLGRNQDGSFYLAALTRGNLKLLAGTAPVAPNNAEELQEKAKKNNVSIFTTPETFAVKNEEALRKWLESKNSAAVDFPVIGETPSAKPLKPGSQKTRKNIP